MAIWMMTSSVVCRRVTGDPLVYIRRYIMAIWLTTSSVICRRVTGDPLVYIRRYIMATG